MGTRYMDGSRHACIPPEKEHIVYGIVLVNTSLKKQDAICFDIIFYSFTGISKDSGVHSSLIWLVFPQGLPAPC
jgi:hypothetical protein